MSARELERQQKKPGHALIRKAGPSQPGVNRPSRAITFFYDSPEKSGSQHASNAFPKNQTSTE
jgi:hypothetical protein